MIDQTIAAKLGEEIANARKSGNQCHPSLPEAAPDMADAMVVQAEAFAAFGSPSIGWKVGATNDAAQANFGISSPFYGPMAYAGQVEPGATIAKSDTVMAVEPEYAFKMARDYPANGEAISVETLTDAVASCHIAIEVIGRCIGAADFQNGIGLTMDFAGNAAFTAGAEVPNWAEKDLADVPVTGLVDGEEVAKGSGAAVLGSPINSLQWLAEQLAASGKQLKAGDFISTGTCTAPIPAKAGQTVTARFGTFGEVSVSFS